LLTICSCLCGHDFCYRCGQPYTRCLCGGDYDDYDDNDDDDDDDSYDED